MRPRRLPAILRTVGLVCLVPLLAHLPELLGLVHTDPLLFVSDLPLHPDSSLLGGKPFIDGNAGETTMALGRLVAEDWLAGRLPWWNPYAGVGLPLAAEMQPAAFFLPFVLLLHFAHGVLYLKITLQILAGLATLGFLQELGITRWAACLGAVLYELNGTFAWYSDVPMFSLPFLPLLLWGVERTYCRTSLGVRGGEAWVGMAIAGSLLAGFPETAFFNGLMGLGWATLRLPALPRRTAFAFARRVALGGLAGLALSAPATLPFVESLPQSSIGFRAVTALFHLGRFHPAALLFPYVFGPLYADLDFRFWIDCGGYLGALTALLALTAMFAQNAGLSSVRRFLGAWLLLVLAAMFQMPLLTPLLRLVPGLDQFYLCRYAMPSVEMAACTLAAFALNDFALRGGGRAILQASVLLAVLAAFALVRAEPKIAADFGSGAFTYVAIGWGVSAVMAMTLLVSRRAGPLHRRAIGLLLVVDALGLFTVPTLSGLTNAQVDRRPVAFLQAQPGFSRAFSTNNDLFPNAGAIFGIGTLEYETIPVPLRWVDYVSAHVDPMALPGALPSLAETSWADALLITDRYRDFAAIGVRYVVAPRAVNLFVATGPTGPKRLYQDDRTEIFELPNTKPYAEAGAGCALAVAERDRMHATCTAPAKLVRRELFYPGWHALVNGRRAGISLQDGLFQVIDLPAGESDIVWRYYPPNSRTMWVVFACGGLALVVFGWREAGRKQGLLF